MERSHFTELTTTEQENVSGGYGYYYCPKPKQEEKPMEMMEMMEKPMEMMEMMEMMEKPMEMMEMMMEKPKKYSH